MARSIAAVYLKKAGDGWPVDLGDDPSFAHAHHEGDRITWGVCRTPLRNALVPGDFVVFFAADRLADCCPASYRWVGFATVEQKISRTEVFERAEFADYAAYPNLLIRPDPAAIGVYEHHEPELKKATWHRDWLWRLVKSRERKDTFMRAGRSEQFDTKCTRVAGALVALAPNYVIFAPEGNGTWVASTPPTIATVSASGSTESWLEIPLAQQLKRLLLAERRASRATLRTTNPQRAHPHLCLSVSPAELRRELETLAREHGISGR